MDEASEELEAALVTIRSHLVQVLAPTNSPGTRRQKKQLADLTRKKLYELVKMLEEDDGEEDEEDEEDPEHIQRYKTLIEEFDANARWDRFLTARLFYLCMTRPVETGACAEHKGLLRLLFGYADQPDRWASALQTPLDSSEDWDVWCEDSQANDTVQDFDEQLVFLPRMIYAFNAESDAQSFVQYVLRMIETLKFIQRWNQRERDDGQRARKWKIKFIEQAFLLSSSENHDLWHRLHHLPTKIVARKPLNQAMKKHSSEHARMITSRNTLLDLYKLFGPGVFLDQLWDPQRPKSKSFRALIDHLKNNMPLLNNKPVNVTRFSWGADSLYNTLATLTGETVARHAQKFLQDNNPDDAARARSWGRRT